MNYVNATSELRSGDSGHMAQPDALTGYITNINHIRDSEYPSLNETTYLDHSGTTLYAKSLIEKYTKDLTSNLFGNPHSASVSSQLSTRRVDDTRIQVLRFLNADPDKFDVVFVANATAAIKLVADAFRDADDGFWYGYHSDAHTSLVGVRELAVKGVRCFRDDLEVEAWISDGGNPHQQAVPTLQLFAYPGQSNMTGHRSPLSWCQSIRNICERTGKRVYSLYDAAALLSTSALDLSNADDAPDFIALSFYKIFGFPDLGALIVRKDSGDILRQRKYFGGGTVDMVITIDGQWHAKKDSTLHSRLEDGTIPFHSIIALETALAVHARIFGSMETISNHCFHLAQKAYEELSALRHQNGTEVCKIYSKGPTFPDKQRQGPVIAFNLLDSSGNYVGKSEVEKLATIKNIQFRTGGLCNPGGIANHLQLSSEEMRRNFSAGQRCGDGHDLIDGKPTGVIRISFGGMSSNEDVRNFLCFINEYYVEKPKIFRQPTESAINTEEIRPPSFVVEGISVYPIKSCAAVKLAPNTPWEVKAKGLAWDREWCLVHQGTRTSLSQKRYPKMALLRPRFDLGRRKLQVTHEIPNTSRNILEISLDQSPLGKFQSRNCQRYTNQPSNICGEQIDVDLYTSAEVTTFFSEALGVPCTLARYPSAGSVRVSRPRMPGSFPEKTTRTHERSIMLSNESPILLVSRSSVNRLNEDIKQTGAVGKAVAADSFRGNIVIAEELQGGQSESPYIEDHWQSLRIGNDEENLFEVMGPCQRCQMVCVDQKSAQRRQEPFSTLAKTRRRDGKVWFGMHLSLAQAAEADRRSYIMIGDKVTVTI